MANEQILQTRVQLLYDTLSNWESDAAKAVVLKAGEVAFVEVTNEDGSKDVIFKVGDGVTPFGTLAYGSAKAADVEAWAKQSEEEFLEYLNGLLTTEGKLENGPFVQVSNYDEFVTAIKGYDEADETQPAYKSVKALSDAIANLEAEVTGGVAGNGQTISARVGELETSVGKAATDTEEATGLFLADEQIWEYVKDGEDSLAAQIDKNAEDIKTLNDNFDKNVEDKVNAMLNTDTNQAAIDTYNEMLEFFAGHEEDGATATQIVTDINDINEALFDTTGEDGSVTKKGLVTKVDEYITANDEAIGELEQDVADKDKALWDYVRDEEGSLVKQIEANDTELAAINATLYGTEAAEGGEATKGLVDKVDEYITANDEAVEALETAVGKPAAEGQDATGLYAADKALWDYVRDADGSLDKRVAANDADNKALWKYITGSESSATAAEGKDLVTRLDAVEQVFVKNTDTLVLQCGNVASLTGTQAAE